MPRLVLIAKSTYVWLDQLSRQFGRDIRTLDAVPDEALDTLASWGITGLWLIGLWQRSAASERIKRRGNAEAVASAYSSTSTGSPTTSAARRPTRTCATERARGIRLSSDMVPNHMGIDSRWVIDHPEWFLSLAQPPYPAYRFTGPDLAPEEPAGIVLEDHYWDDSDAAVVFKRFDRASGKERFIYHGNDGTSFPLERHRPARLPQARGARAGDPDHRRRRAAVPGDPVRRGDGAGEAARPAVGGPNPGRATASRPVPSTR